MNTYSLIISDTIVGFTLTVVNDFRQFLSPFSTNCHEISQTKFSIQVATILKISLKNIVGPMV